MNWIVLLLAIGDVESGMNDNAIGDNGKSIGALQIQKAVVQDVNRHYGLEMKHSQMKDRKVAMATCVAYLTMWGKHYEKTTGRKPTAEIYARIWNGGPNGWKKQATEKYWEKVQKCLTTP